MMNSFVSAIMKKIVHEKKQSIKMKYDKIIL